MTQNWLSAGQHSSPGGILFAGAHSRRDRRQRQPQLLCWGLRAHSPFGADSGCRSLLHLVGGSLGASAPAVCGLPPLNGPDGSGGSTGGGSTSVGHICSVLRADGHQDEEVCGSEGVGGEALPGPEGLGRGASRFLAACGWGRVAKRHGSRSGAGSFSGPRASPGVMRLGFSRMSKCFLLKDRLQAVWVLILLFGRCSGMTAEVMPSACGSSGTARVGLSVRRMCFVCRPMCLFRFLFS